MKLERIVADIPGSDKETVRVHLQLLEDAKYIRRVRTSFGHKITVLNSKKRNVWGQVEKAKPQNTVSPTLEKPQNTVSPGSMKRHFTVGETVKHGRRNGIYRVNIVDNAVDIAEDRAVLQGKPPAAASAALWGSLSLAPEVLPPAFRQFAEKFFAEHGDQTDLEVSGLIMDGWQILKNRIPAPFAKAVATLRQKHKSEPVKTKVPLLVPEAWAR